ncbi:MAG: electron transport complex subunit RsxB [Gammaproteobacteria bacterium]
MLAAVLALGIMAGLFGLLLGYSAVRFRVEGDPVVDEVESLLPQTQCGQCDFAGCRPYAEAVAHGEAAVNRCAPGGEATMLAIADLLDLEPEALDPEHDRSGAPVVAVIDEDTCIGCTKCIQACPVDAILGAAKHMHTVIAAECTGCELCLPPCPVDCIDLVAIPETFSTYSYPRPPMPVGEAA